MSELPLLRRAAVVPELLPLLVLPLLRFTWVVEVLPSLLVALPRFTWLPELLPVVLPRRTWVEVLPEGVAALWVAVLLWRVAVEVEVVL